MNVNMLYKSLFSLLSKTLKLEASLGAALSPAQSKSAFQTLNKLNAMKISRLRSVVSNYNTKSRDRATWIRIWFQLPGSKFRANTQSGRCYEGRKHDPESDRNIHVVWKLPIVTCQIDDHQLCDDNIRTTWSND